MEVHVLLRIEDTVLVVVDVQGKLARVVHESDATIRAAAKLIRCAKALGLPIVRTEQNPKGLGPTVPELAGLLDGEAIAKVAFSCCGEKGFLDTMSRLGRNQVLLAGIETHVCVYQTAIDLHKFGYEVHVVADAVSSRTPANREIGLRKMEQAGADVTSVETALFELQRVAEGPAFKELMRIVKLPGARPAS